MDKPKIEVRRSAIVIHNYEPGDCVQLEEFFKVYNKTTRLREDRIITYDEYSRDLYLPRGFDLNILSDFFYSEPYFSPEYDEYDSELYFRLVNPPRDDVQREAIHFIAGLSKYEDIKNEPQLCVNLNTGAGKTYVTIACSTYLGVRSIMITSSNGWIEQWADRILEYTDTAPSEIYKLIGISSIAMILHNKVKIKNIKYILASHMTIKSYGDKYGWDKVRDLFKKLRVGIKIYDEAHLDFDNICKIDFVTNTFKTLYLTATPARSDRTEDLIYQASFKTCPKIDLFNKETDPRTHYMAILYNSYPDQKVINKCNNPWKKMFDPNAYCKYIIKNPRFYNMLKIILEEIFIRGKALIYVGLNEAALIIRSIMGLLHRHYFVLNNDIITPYIVFGLSCSFRLLNEYGCDGVDIHRLPRPHSKVRDCVDGNIFEITTRETRCLRRKKSEVNTVFKWNLRRKNRLQNTTASCLVGKWNLDMNWNASNKRIIKVTGKIRRECDDAIKSVKLLEHNGSCNIDGLVGGLSDGSHALAEDAVRLVEEEKRILLVCGLECRDDVLARFTDILALDFGITYVDKSLTPFASQRLNAHGLACTRRSVEIEGDMSSAGIGLAKPPVFIHKSVRLKTVLQ